MAPQEKNPSHTTRWPGALHLVRNSSSATSRLRSGHCTTDRVSPVRRRYLAVPPCETRWSRRTALSRHTRGALKVRRPVPRKGNDRAAFVARGRVVDNLGQMGVCTHIHATRPAAGAAAAITGKARAAAAAASLAPRAAGVAAAAMRTPTARAAAVWAAALTLAAAALAVFIVTARAAKTAARAVATCGARPRPRPRHGVYYDRYGAKIPYTFKK